MWNRQIRFLHLRFISLGAVLAVVSLFSLESSTPSNATNATYAVDVQAANQVDLELVLAIDTSTSVDANEFNLQQVGLARAFLHNQVIDAILSTGKQGVAVSVVYWAGNNQQVTTVNWTILRSALDAQLFAAKIFAAQRVFSGMTDIGGAISFSVNSLETNGIVGLRRTIDVSGDGSANPTQSETGRNLALTNNITVNGLVIDNEDMDLGILSKWQIRKHYQDHVIGGPGSFIMIADDFTDFARAIRLKLVREIRGMNLVNVE